MSWTDGVGKMVGKAGCGKRRRYTWKIEGNVVKRIFSILLLGCWVAGFC